MIITGVVSPSAIASRHEDRGAHAALRRALGVALGPLPRRRERSIARASPTVTTEPGDQHAAGADRLAERRRRPRPAPRPGRSRRRARGRSLTRSWPKMPRATSASSAAGIARVGGVLGADDVGEVRLERGEQPLVVLVGHHADHADQRART